MNTVARARFVRVSARKARLVLDQIRGKSVGDALATREYTPRAAAHEAAGRQGGRGQGARDQGARPGRTQAQGEEIGDGSEDASDRLPPRLDPDMVVALVRDEELRRPPARGRQDPALHQGPALPDRKSTR